MEKQKQKSGGEKRLALERIRSKYTMKHEKGFRAPSMEVGSKQHASPKNSKNLINLRLI